MGSLSPAKVSHPGIPLFGPKRRAALDLFDDFRGCEGARQAGQQVDMVFLVVRATLAVWFSRANYCLLSSDGLRYEGR